MPQQPPCQHLKDDNVRAVKVEFLNGEVLHLAEGTLYVPAMSDWRRRNRHLKTA